MKDPHDIFHQFSAQAKKILTTSQQVAESTQTGIGSEHILIALAITPQTVAYELLKEYAITLEQIRLVISLNDLWTRRGNSLSDEAKNILKLSLQTAGKFQQTEVEPEHILYAITLLPESRGHQAIARVGVDPRHLRQQLEGMIASGSDLRLVIEPDLNLDKLEELDLHEHVHDHDDEEEEEEGAINYPGQQATPQTNNGSSAAKRTREKLLPQFTIDLLDQAKSGKLDPVIMRDAEIQRAIQILARRTKNNPVLIGDPGVGKTAIVEGLAQRIAAGNVPALLKNRRILQLDLALLVAGTMYRGQFEERLKRIMKEIAADPNIIIFIDELHTMVGTGSAEGSMDAANMLKPALARGEIRLIGATTIDDYRKTIERDPALERRFQTIFVAEPNSETTVSILEGLRPRLEKHHRVHITDSAVRAAVRLAERYITERALPDKAIDLLDEASAAIQVRTPDTSAQRIDRLERQLRTLREQKEQEIEQQAFAKAAKLRTQEVLVRTKIERLKKQLDRRQRPLVDQTDIAQVTSLWTGIPFDHLIRTERITTNIAERLTQHLVGQDDAIQTITRALRRAQAGLAPKKRPLGSFLFLGPTGVGKTELARTLAREVFGSDDAFIKIDMSEFMERHSLARLVGAPAGYVGYDDGGKLTDAIRQRPYALLLLDEFEKAHPEVQNLLLQIMEDGTLTDAKGRHISFANTLIILTSNLGSASLTRAQALGFNVQSTKAQSAQEEEYLTLQNQVLEQVREFFRPEFINRLDATIVFRPLTQSSIRQIVDLQTEDLIKRINEEGYTLTVTNRARKHLAEHGFDSEFGARPIRRLIAEWVTDPIADIILEHKPKPGSLLEADLKKGTIVITVKDQKTSKRIEYNPK